MSEIVLHQADADTASAGDSTASRRGFSQVAATVTAGIAGLFLGVRGTRAANGGSVLLGKSNTATASTAVTTSTGTAISGTGPIGVSGKASVTTATAPGVQGTASGTNYGVMSAGKLGTTGPIEMASLTVANWSTPAAGKAYLYTKTNATVTELRLKLPSGGDVLIASG